MFVYLVVAYYELYFLKVSVFDTLMTLPTVYSGSGTEL